MRYVIILAVLALVVVILLPVFMAIGRAIMNWIANLSDDLAGTDASDEEYDSHDNYNIPEVVTLKRDIVIPAGTNLQLAPTKTVRYTPAFEYIMGLGADHTGYFTIDLDAIQEHPHLFAINEPYDPNDQEGHVPA